MSAMASNTGPNSRRLTTVIPVLNEAAIIGPALEALAQLRSRGAEVIVADGGSGDGTAQLARPLADQVIDGPCSRGAAMNAGAAAGTGDLRLFLHADTMLPHHADDLIERALTRRCWGRFDVRIAGRHPLLRVVGCMIGLRSRLTGIATGDQAMFVTREAFETVGRFTDLPLMEDIALSRKLKRLCRPLCIGTPVITSGRRWEQHGVVRTIVLMCSCVLPTTSASHRRCSRGATAARPAPQPQPFSPSAAQGRARP
jgi:rSAM/selenodomain-associated transferase 2